MKSTVFLIIPLAGMLFTSQAIGRDYSKQELLYFQHHSTRETKYNTGAEIAQYLTEDYNNKALDCGTTSTPAFLCSGVLFRGTDVFSTAYHSWNPSPASVSSGGVSFSYLRADSKFNKLAYSYNNGFIFFPYFYAPDTTNTNIDILCSFPIDASTDNRSDKGCGASNAYPSQSGPCQQQNILTAEQWHEHYLEGGSNHQYQCGFDTADESTLNTADGFYQTILSMATIPNESIGEQNELRLATWGQDQQDTLPIEAFFYINGNSTGKNSAQKNQEDFYNSTTNNIWVPVIRLTLPATASENASFVYDPADQLIPEPVANRN